MEIKKVENRTFGDYYRVTGTLKVNGKPYRGSQRTSDPQKLGAQWDLTRSQMISILQNTKPQDWLFRSKGHFDGQVDGWEYDKEDFKPASQETISWVIDQLRTFDGYRIQYNAGDQDNFTNKIERGAFEIWNTAIHSFEMRPASDNLVKFELENPPRTQNLTNDPSPNERKRYEIEVKDEYGNVSTQEANSHIEAIAKHKKLYPQEHPHIFETRTRTQEFEQLKENIALGVGADPAKVEHVNRWLTYLVAELKGTSKGARQQLAQMCIAALAQEAGVEPDQEEDETSYIG